MNTKRISIVAVMALAVVMTAVAPGLASAQQLVGGKFSLPCTTYWGNATLPAGSYTFTVTRTTANAGVVSIRGAKDLRLMTIIDRDRFLKDSALDVRRSGGSAVVTDMHIAEGGISMKFRTTPAAKELLASASTPEGTTEKIVVSVE